MYYLKNIEDSRILFGNFQDRPLTRHQHTLVMEPFKHSQGAVGHDDLILCYLEIGQLYWIKKQNKNTLNSIRGTEDLQGGTISVSTHGDSQDVGELVGFCLSEAVPCICDKNHRHHELSPRVDQLLECLPSGRDQQPSAHQDAIDVKEQPETWLRLRKQ